MRPRSIVLFDWLYLGSLLASLLTVPSAYLKTMDTVRADPIVTPITNSIGVIFLVTIAVVFGLSLLLWFLVSKRASNTARWILVAFTAIGVLGLIPSLMRPIPDPAQMAISVVLAIIQTLAVLALFREDARDWFAGKKHVDPDVFR